MNVVPSFAEAMAGKNVNPSFAPASVKTLAGKKASAGKNVVNVINVVNVPSLL